MVVLCFPPSQAGGQASICAFAKGYDDNNSEEGDDEGEDGEGAEDGAQGLRMGGSCCRGRLFDDLSAYLSKAGDLMVRSLLLSGSVWSLSVASARVSSAALAANAVVLQLWMVTVSGRLVDAWVWDRLISSLARDVHM